MPLIFLEASDSGPLQGYQHCKEVFGVAASCLPECSKSKRPAVEPNAQACLSVLEWLEDLACNVIFVECLSFIYSF